MESVQVAPGPTTIVSAIVSLVALMSASLYGLSYAAKTGFIVLATGDQVMEVKNRPGFEPKRW